jgi:5-formyltetrahydrofolate cyclo-ligase
MNDAKQALRSALVAARLRLDPADRAARSRAVTERVAGLDAFRTARTVALYAPLGAEVDTAGVARLAGAAGKRLAWPRLHPGDRAMTFAACAAADLVAGPLRALEPPATAAAVPAGELDLVLVPGVAFDAAGRRLGRGRGHYDATLAAAGAAFLCGLAYEVQMVEQVPSEAHDVALDAVVTEARVLRPAARAARTAAP